MTESEVLEEVQSPIVEDGELGLDSDGNGNLPLCGSVQSTEVRRSERMKSHMSRTISTRGRVGHQRPKSPLLRMAEMRRGGLRGKALRMVGSKGFEGSDPKLFSGKKRPGGRKAQVLASIPEGAVEIEGSMVVSGEGMTADRPVEGTGVEMVNDLCDKALEVLSPLNFQMQRAEDEPLVLKEPIPVGTSADLALDLISSQPLQDMTFIGEQGGSDLSGKDFLMLDSVRGDEEGSMLNERGLNQEGNAEEDFPALNRENLRAERGKGRNRGGEGEEVVRGVDQMAKDKNIPGGNVRPNSWNGGKNYKASLSGGVNIMVITR